MDKDTELQSFFDGLNHETNIIIQGITGKEGQRVAEFMLASRANVVAGVRPGKGGETILGVKVYDTMEQAIHAFPKADTSCVYVPPAVVLSAVKEALGAGIKRLHIIAEGVPLKDTALIITLCKKHQAFLLGPSSLGMIIPDQVKIGSIGGLDNSSFMPGSVGILSRSGGMSSELANVLTCKNIGQSCVIHLGGDYLIGSTMLQAALYLEKDRKTKIITVVGEVGGTLELELASAIAHKQIKKPVIVFLAGQFVESLPQGIPLGHAGAIIGSAKETREGKKMALQNAGAIVVSTPQQLVKQIVSNLSLYH